MGELENKMPLSAYARTPNEMKLMELFRENEYLKMKVKELEAKTESGRCGICGKKWAMICLDCIEYVNMSRRR